MTPPIRFAARSLLLCHFLVCAGQAHFGFAQAPPAREGDTISHALAAAILDNNQAKQELRAVVAARIPQLDEPPTSQEWNIRSARLRQQVLNEVVFRGEARAWRDSETQVVWLDTIDEGQGYRIKKFRYEALPGFWIPALLYEPETLREKMPVVINPNGHHRGGKAMPYKQRRCINLARRGILAYNLEFIDMGQLRHSGNKHNRLVQLDLCGTSGLAPFYLALQRGLDVALSHDQADLHRVGVTGLSGGGWQTIMLAALDERITLANPVAGYCSLLARVNGDNNIGDAEQIPADLCRLADYTHLTAMVAPRPLLLTYNARDDCCFLPDLVLEELERVGKSFYRLSSVAQNFQTHINHDPGTHNFDRDNREALYRFLHRHGFMDEKNQPTGEPTLEIVVDDAELKTAAELAVTLPAENLTLHELALRASKTLPTSPDQHNVPLNLEDRRNQLKQIIHQPSLTAQATRVEQNHDHGLVIVHWQLRLGSAWTVPVVEFRPQNATETCLLLNDRGKQASAEAVGALLAARQRVLAVDLLGFGEADPGSEPGDNDDVMPLLLATVGDRALGTQVAQLTAIAGWSAGAEVNPRPTITALGPRNSSIALIAAASEPSKFSGLRLQNAWPSLREIIMQNMKAEDAPEQFCFGLLKHFDVPQLVAMAKPLPVVFESGKNPER